MSPLSEKRLNANMLAGIDLVVRGDSPGERADSFLASLIEHGLAEIVEDDGPDASFGPAVAFSGISMGNIHCEAPMTCSVTFLMRQFGDLTN